jgi:glycosyltransferase 2 family protein
MNDTTVLAPSPSGSKGNTLRTVLIYGVAAAALYWVFRDVKIGELRRDLLNICWPLAVLGMAVDVGRYVTQSIRWRFLLEPIGRISFGKTFKALYAGVFLNLILPLRMGEAARAYLASRFSGARFPTVVSTMFVEYIIDGIWMAAGIGVTALFVTLPANVALAARILGIVMLAVVALFVFFVVVRGSESLFTGVPGRRFGPVRRLTRFLDTIRGGLRVVGRSNFLWASFAVSSFDFLFHIVAFWILMIAYGINLPFEVAAAILLFVFVGLIIPTTPSNVGTFQFLCKLGLMLFGVDATKAAGFSVVFFVLVLLPQAAIGCVAFLMSGEKLWEIRSALASLRQPAVQRSEP